MYPYKAPLRDMRFVLHEVLEFEAHYLSIGRDDVSREVLDSILEEGARFTETVLAPLNSTGDAEGAYYENGAVRTPKGFREAYLHYCRDGWASMTAPVEHSGQGLPRSLEVPFDEMLAAANLAWRTYSGLAASAVEATHRHASTDLQVRYLPRLASGEWGATMCLTEPQCGTDLGLIRTRAEPDDAGAYRLTGTKMFITGGEHDLTDNIVHFVLAKLPDAPPGTKGISLFLVPKFLPAGTGSPGRRNSVVCASIEHKMGLRGSATCTMSFDGAVGWLVGGPHQGLACMFTMMNHARISVGMQGLGIAERAFQSAVTYARERRQGRAPGSSQAAGAPADPIIGHPDVRRMLLTQKALIEGARVLAYFTAKQLDLAQLDLAHASGGTHARAAASDLLGLLTPIVKALTTEIAVEAASLTIQVHGGHGYVRETGVEQYLRDARVLPIYEGTNGVQALDLLGRKVMRSEGAIIKRLTTLIAGFCARYASVVPLSPRIATLAAMAHEWEDITARVIAAARTDASEVGAASVDYLHFTGYLCLAWCWAWTEAVARNKLAGGTAQERVDLGAGPGAEAGADGDFYRAKLVTAAFFFEKVVPRARAHAAAMLSGARTLMALSAEHFRF